MSTSWYTRNQYMPHGEPLVFPSSLWDTEGNTAACPDVRTSTEEAHEERWDTYAAYKRLKRDGCTTVRVVIQVTFVRARAARAKCHF